MRRWTALIGIRITSSGSAPKPELPLVSSRPIDVAGDLLQPDDRADRIAVGEKRLLHGVAENADGAAALDLGVGEAASAGDVPLARIEIAVVGAGHRHGMIEVAEDGGEAAAGDGRGGVMTPATCVWMASTSCAVNDFWSAVALGRTEARLPRTHQQDVAAEAGNAGGDLRGRPLPQRDHDDDPRRRRSPRRAR